MKIHVMMDNSVVMNFDSDLLPAIGDRVAVTTKENGDVEGVIVSREWDLRSKEKILYVKAQSDKEASKAAKAKKSKESSG